MAVYKAAKASRIIELLAKAIKKHGDLPVHIHTELCERRDVLPKSNSLAFNTFKSLAINDNPPIIVLQIEPMDWEFNPDKNYGYT